MGHSPLSRFSDRVADYRRARPSYPPAVVEIVRNSGALPTGAVVADVGSGTGLSSALFLEMGHEVYGVEPNAAMRAAAEAAYADQPRFHSVDGIAEATTLADASVDLVVAGQAFHWFDAAEARREFARILRPPGWVLLMWNIRRTEGTAFLRAYEALLQSHGTDYREVSGRWGRFESLFAGGRFTERALPNVQVLDRDGLRARLLSSSYTPAEGDRGREPMLAELDAIFAAHEESGRVRIEYDTKLYIGRVHA